MRIIIILLAFILMTACQDQKKDPRVEKFEDYIGKSYSELLSKKVDSFEKFLEINFSHLNTEEAYSAYLDLIESGEFEESNWNYEGTGYNEINRMIENSGLRREIWLHPDTVWIENGKLYYGYVYIDQRDTFMISGNSLTPIYKSIENKDSVIDLEKQSLTFNLHGKYFRGLELIKDSDSTLITYVDDKLAVINLAPSIIAGGLIYTNADFNDYFVKRIIATELY